MNKTCRNCTHWEFPHDNETFGKCRRHAPRAIDTGAEWTFPITRNECKCGEWKQYARPCPICGDDDVRTNGSQLRATEDFDAATPAPNKIWAASCFSCNLYPGAFGYSPVQAIEAWNKRTERL